MAKVINANIKFNKPLSPLNISGVKYIVLHHTASNGHTPESLNKQHKARGWSGAGYNEYIRKDGTVYILRGDHIGAHCEHYNKVGYGISCEGNFMLDKMPEVQKIALLERIRHNYNRMNKPKIVGHKELGQTACPGAHYPLSEAKECVKKVAPIVKPDVKKELSLNTLKVGSIGGQVKIVQKKLGVEVDGIFGRLTKVAVEKFQKAKKLVVDGVVGAKTWKHIL